MAITELYMQPTGNDTNSGSSSSDNPAATSVNGAWDGTSVFTPADGLNPVASGFAVGQFLSVFITGAASVVFVAPILSVVNAINGAITIDAANKIGTAPVSTGGANKTVKQGGAWASLGIGSTLGAAVPPFSIRINVKAGTYANGATSRQFTINAPAGVLLWLRGYKTSPGDLDAVPVAAWIPGVDCPFFTFTTGKFTLAGAHEQLSALAILSSAASATVTLSGTYCAAERCLIENQNPGANSNAIGLGNTAQKVTDCYLRATSSAPVVTSTAVAGLIFGNYIGGGSTAIFTNAGVGLQIIGNIIDQPAGDACSVQANDAFTFSANTIYAPTGHGLTLIATLVSAGTIANNLFHSVNQAGKACINYAGSTPIDSLYISGNANFQCPILSAGLPDMPQWYWTTETVDPLPGAAAKNFALNPAAASRGKGQNSVLPVGSVLTSIALLPGNLDVGAVQIVPSVGGGGFGLQ